MRIKISPRISEAARGNYKRVNRNSDKTVTNLNPTTKDNVTQDSFQKHIKHFAFMVASSVSDTNRTKLPKGQRAIKD